MDQFLIKRKQSSKLVIVTSVFIGQLHFIIHDLLFLPISTVESRVS